MIPAPTARLSFRCMTDADLDQMCRLLGDPDVMRYYPRPKSRDEVQRWINWSKSNYADHGFGLWIIEDKDSGAFIGDCGLTWQNVDGEAVLEIGYHVLADQQGRGYATEAATACLLCADANLAVSMVTAIINPENLPSRRVAEHLGMTLWKTTREPDGTPIVVYARSKQSA